MTIELLKKQLEEKESIKLKTESVYFQLVGQINLLKEMIKAEESSTKAE